MLKVDGNKVLLFFHFGLQSPRYRHLLVFIIICFNMNDEKITKWPYLGRFDSKWKNKGTLFSSTLKVEGNKVLLFFHFGLKSPRYEDFLVFLQIIIIDDFDVGQDDENNDFDSFHRYHLIVNLKTCQLETKTDWFCCIKGPFHWVENGQFWPFYNVKWPKFESEALEGARGPI